MKKLIATGYKKNCRGLKLIYDSNCKDANVELLEGNGDFRSEECVKLLDEADIVVTNSPFSLFHEYIAQLVKYDKKFLIIGNINSITYKEIFPLIKNNKLWLGFGTDSWYRVPDDFDDRPGVKIEDGKKYFKVKSRWFTNLDNKKHHEFLTLTEKYDPAKYPKYDNYDAINVDKVNDIPKDYDGVMGVPITFLDKYNPEQFEIVQFRKGEDGRDLAFTVERENEWCRTSGCSYEEFEKKFPLTKVQNPGMLKNAEGVINGKATYARVLIERRKPVSEKRKDADRR